MEGPITTFLLELVHGWMLVRLLMVYFIRFYDLGWWPWPEMHLLSTYIHPTPSSRLWSFILIAKKFGTPAGQSMRKNAAHLQWRPYLASHSDSIGAVKSANMLVRTNSSLISSECHIEARNLYLKRGFEIFRSYPQEYLFGLISWQMYRYRISCSNSTIIVNASWFATLRQPNGVTNEYVLFFMHKKYAI